MPSSDAASWWAPPSASADVSRSPAPTSNRSPGPDCCARSSTGAGYAPTSSSAARSSSATKSFRPTNHPIATKSCGESRSSDRAGGPRGSRRGLYCPPSNWGHGDDRPPPPPPGRVAAGHACRALLRPRVRVRRDPALAHVARTPDPPGCARDSCALPRRLVGVELHRLGDELDRPRSRGSASAVKTGEPVLVLGTTNGTTITATLVIVQPTGGGSATSLAVVPFQQGAPTTSKQVGQIPSNYSQGSGTIVSGTTANKATEAALASYPGGIVDRVVKLSNGEYEVHNIGVNWPHHIFVDKNFKVVGAD